jgi:ATP-dependent DNA ligase
VQLEYPLETSHDGDQIHIDGEVTYPVRVEPKLDGLRCVAIKQGGEVTLFTRNGRVIESLPTIQAALEKANYDNTVLDGEAMGEDWNESASIVGSKKNKKDDSGIYFHVFDAVPLKCWHEQNAPLTMAARVNLLTATVSNITGPVLPVPGKTVNSEEELMAFYEKSLEDDFEGIMLKDLKAPYEFKRSRQTRKMKPVATYEGTVVGWYFGREGTKNHGKFGGYVMLLDNGVTTRVGGGYSDVERATNLIEDPDTHVGRIIEVEGQPPLTKDGRVRFPVFIRYRDVSDVDPKIPAAYEAWMQSDKVLEDS